MRSSLVVATAGLLVFWPLSSPSAAQQREIVASEAVISPSAFVTCYARSEGGVAREVVLLMVFRGSKGWTSGRIAGTSAPFDVNRPELRAARRHLLEAGYQIGAVSLTWSFDPVSRLVQVLDQQVNLGASNVVLVDSVDVPSALRVVGTLHIDPSLVPETDLRPSPGGRPSLDIVRIAGRSPALKAFLGGAPWPR